jgi:hypothetical protein
MDSNWINPIEMFLEANTNEERTGFLANNIFANEYRSFCRDNDQQPTLSGFLGYLESKPKKEDPDRIKAVVEELESIIKKDRKKMIL